MYPLLFRAVLSRFDPEFAHHAGMAVIRVLGVPPFSWATRAITRPDSSLRVEALGLTFPSPFGVAAGFDKNGALTPEMQEKALAALSRFHEKLAGLPATQVRAVGTQALREAANSSEFLPKAEAALGYPIGILSGHEEARLVKRLPANEALAKTKKEAVGLQNETVGLVRGGLRQALLKLGEMGGDASHTAFMASLLGAVYVELDALRDEFGLPLATVDTTPEWERWAKAQGASAAAAAAN